MRTVLIERATRSWTFRGGVALVDQAIFAGSNFGLNVYLARSLSPAEFGVFVFTLAIVLAFFGLYSAVQLEPASVLGPSAYRDRSRGYLRAQLRIHFCLTAVIGMLLVVTGFAVDAIDTTQVGRTFVAAGLACPPMLLYHLARRLLYTRDLGIRALGGSLLYASTLGGGVLLAHRYGWLSPAVAFGVQALAGGAASAYMVWRLQAGGAVNVEDPCQMRPLVREQWKYGKYLVGIVLLQSAAVQGLTFMTSAMLGFGALGVLRAMQSFVLPFGHTMIALFAVAQPALARDFGSGRFDALGRKGMAVAGVIVCLAIAGEISFLAFHQQMEHLLFGGKFAAYSGLIPVFGAAIIFEGLAGTQALVLRAVQRPRLHMLSVAATAPLALAIGFVLIRWCGIWGAAAATAVTWAVAAAVTHPMSRRWLPLSPGPLLMKPGVTSSSV